jgi:adenosylhomocysteine nucleosidase
MILLSYAMPEEAPRCPIPTHCRRVLTGIGKVLAVTQIAKAICERRPELIVNVGFCGGLNGSAQGALVLPSETRQWDLDLRPLDLPLGHGYAMHCPLRLPRVDLRALPNPVCGRIISGDRFVDSSVHVDPQAVAVDMETAAIALLACEFGIPFVSVREVSDVADGPQGVPHQQFMNYVTKNGPGYSAAVAEILQNPSPFLSCRVERWAP